MKTRDYETLARVNQFKRVVKVAIITIVICIAVLAPLLWYWTASIEMHTVFRNAKNVQLNSELLSVMLDGQQIPFLDNSRPSGLSEEAEAQIKSYSGAEGEIKLTAWDRESGSVMSMTYIEKRYLIKYEKEEGAETGEWTIYRKTHVYEG